MASAPTSRSIGLILARQGSKGIPGKNLRDLAGSPLIGRAIETLDATPGVDRVLVSTDAPEIASVAREHGAETPFLRPAGLAADDTPAVAAVAHAARALREAGDPVTRIVLLQATAPLTTPADVAAAMETFERNGADHLVSVTQVEEHPHWMGTVEDGVLQFLFAAETRALRRQDLPAMYRLNGAIYIYDVDVLIHSEDPTAVEWRRVAAYEMPRARSVDIDTEADWNRAEVELARLRAQQ